MNPRARTVLAAVVIFAAVIAIYSPVLRGGTEFLAWDDDIEIRDNLHIRSLDAQSVKWMFTDVQQTMRYTPLSWLNWAIRYRLFGLDPRAFHFGGVLLHAANSVLVFLLIRALLRKANDFVAAAAALLWAAHPMRVEAAAWATQERFVLASFFALLAVLLYLAACSRRENAWKTWQYWAGALVASVAVFCYPVVAPLPAVLFVLDLYPLRRRMDLKFWPRVWTLAIEKIPFALAVIFVAAMTLRGRWAHTEYWTPPPTFSEFPLIDRAAQAVYVWMIYLWREIVPLHLSPLYTRLIHFRPTDWPFILSAIAFVLITAAALVLRKRAPGVLAFWACYSLLLLPFSLLGFMEHPYSASDRYCYLESIALAVAAAFLLSRIWRPALLIPLAAAALALAIVSNRLCNTWRDSISLFEQILARIDGHPHQADIWWRLGMAYLDHQRFDDAIRAADQTLRLWPDDPAALMVKGTAEIGRDPALAVELLQRALAGEKRWPNITRNRLGVALLADGRFFEAQRELEICIAASPGWDEPHWWLAELFRRQGKLFDAQREYETVLRLDPQHQQARGRLAELNERLTR